MNKDEERLSRRQRLMDNKAYQTMESLTRYMDRYYLDALIVSLTECPDGFRLANLTCPLHYQRLPLWIVFPIQKVLVYLPF